MITMKFDFSKSDMSSPPQTCYYLAGWAYTVYIWWQKGELDLDRGDGDGQLKGWGWLEGFELRYSWRIINYVLEIDPKGQLSTTKKRWVFSNSAMCGTLFV